jgi:hypothetical protein
MPAAVLTLFVGSFGVQACVIILVVDNGEDIGWF